MVMMIAGHHTVALVRRQPAVYSSRPPYHPPDQYLELPIKSDRDASNVAYEAVREAFLMLGYDSSHAGTSRWNPLSWLIKPGETVFIKPNMIAHKHEYTEEWEHVITHGSVIRAVVDYVFLALQGTGRVIIGDGCQSNSDFDKIIARQGLLELKEYYKREAGFELEILDLRDYHWVEKKGVFVDQRSLPGDPSGKVVVDLGQRSMFAELDGKGKRYYGATYDVEETNLHHSGGRHEYAFSRSPLDADVFINLPKLKTHKKCGLTVNLKSLVGLNANKNWLPHYVFGSPEVGGDQFDVGRTSARLENALVLKAKALLLKRNAVLQRLGGLGKTLGYTLLGRTDQVIRSGNWYGNDTVWRMCLDLNRILFYCDSAGTFRDQPKRYLSVVDGIIAMEGNGPVAGTKKPIGVLIAGENPVAVDLVCARLMGFDYQKLPILHRSMGTHPHPLYAGNCGDIYTVSNVSGWNRRLTEWTRADIIPFEPHFGWKGHIELEE